MRSTLFGVLSAAVVLGIAASAANAADNPGYQYWSGWRAGATATTKTEVVSGGMKITGKATATLKSVAADKVVVELATSMEFGGMKIDSPAASTDIPAKLPAAPKGKVTTGTETLTVNGKKLECEWTRTEAETGEVTKTWMCKDVPGGIVKETIASADGTTTSNLVEWKGEKK